MLWKRIFKKDRVIKELIESAPIIEAVKQVVEAATNVHDEDAIADSILGSETQATVHAYKIAETIDSDATGRVDR